MKPAQQYLIAILSRIGFAFILVISLFAFTPGKVSASWIYDRDQPKITVTLNCNDGGTHTPATYDPANPGAWNPDLGVCNDDTAQFTITCTDVPGAPSGSGCQTLVTNSSKDNNNVDHTATGTQGTQTLSYTTTGNISASSTKNDSPPYTAYVTKAIATDWAGNISSIPSSAYFVFRSCSISLSPTPDTHIKEGESGVAIANVNSGTVDRIDFSLSGNNGNASINPTSDSTATYQTTITGITRTGTPSSVYLNANGYINNRLRCTASPATNIIVDAVSPWWQVSDNDLYANGNLTSNIPTSCTGSCSNKFDMETTAISGITTGGYPGIPNYNSGTAPNFTPNGVISSTLWIANSSYTGRTYDYSWFLNQTGIPADQIISDTSAARLPSGTADNSTNANTGLNTGLSFGGALYRYSPGNLIITQDINVGTNKVVLFVNGDVTINGKINLTRGQGFFAIISNGNINVAGSVTNGANAALEGFYLAQNSFNTGTSNNRLVVRGSVATINGGVQLRRDLLTTNTTTPAEVFQYAPDLVGTMPYQLMRQGITWQEINP